MMIDARRIPTGDIIETDVCIIGAGPAGITIAHELAGQPMQVCLLETGGLEPNEEIQQLATGEGDTIGDSYPGAYWMRHRQYGGTAHRWNIDLDQRGPGVRYVPFDPIDFEKKDWVPHSGWPFDKSELDPYYARAQVTCKIGSYAYQPEDWADGQAPEIKFASGNVVTKMFQCGPRDVYLDEYRKEIERSPNLTAYLYATAVELETDEQAQRVTHIRVATLEGNEFHVAAKYVILAKGGIESARLLLLSDQVQKNGLGNEHDVVGRYFMDHQMVRVGLLHPTQRDLFNRAFLYDLRPVNGTHVIGKFVLSEAVQRRQKLLNIATAIFPRSDIYRYNPMRMLFPKGKNFRSKSVASVQAFLKAARDRKLPQNTLGHLATIATGVDDILYFQLRREPIFSHPTGIWGFDQGGWSALPNPAERFSLFEVIQMAEQAPDPENRVKLGTERDRLGCRRVKVYWRWNEIDTQSILKTQDILADEFARAGLGRLQIQRDYDLPQPLLTSIHHHMGLTRMHDNPRHGVVDAHCQVHGVSNLFVVSSSVFPTGGYANPTLTIIAIAIRVADQVKYRLHHQAIQL